MATTFSCLRAAPILSSAAPKPGPAYHKPSSSPSSSAANWWAPIFSWSSEPDYIANGPKAQVGREAVAQQVDALEKEAGRAGLRPRSKLGLGCFTEEKARELRKKTAETSTFHDVMYHSAIASRLASDISPRHHPA